MPEFPLALRDPDETLTVVLNKAPGRGAWFDVSGATIKVDDVRHLGSELVIIGVRVEPAQRASLNPKKHRNARLA